MQSLVGVGLDSREYPEAQRQVVRPTSEAIVSIVACVFGVDVEQLRRRSHHPARKAVARLRSHDAGATLATIGEWMGITGQAAAYLARQAVDLERHDEAFGTLVSGIMRRLEASEDRCESDQASCLD